MSEFDDAVERLMRFAKMPRAKAEAAVHKRQLKAGALEMLKKVSQGTIGRGEFMAGVSLLANAAGDANTETGGSPTAETVVDRPSPSPSPTPEPAAPPSEPPPMPVETPSTAWPPSTVEPPPVASTVPPLNRIEPPPIAAKTPPPIPTPSAGGLGAIAGEALGVGAGVLGGDLTAEGIKIIIDAMREAPGSVRQFIPGESGSSGSMEASQQQVLGALMKIANIRNHV